MDERWGQSAWELPVSRDRRGSLGALFDWRAAESRVVMALIMYVSEMHNSCIRRISKASTILQSAHKYFIFLKFIH